MNNGTNMMELKPGLLEGLTPEEKYRWVNLITSEPTEFHGSRYSSLKVP